MFLDWFCFSHGSVNCWNVDYVGSEFGIKVVLSFNAAFGCGDLLLTFPVGLEIPKLSVYYSALDDNHDLDVVQRVFYIHNFPATANKAPFSSFKDERMGVTRVRHSLVCCGV